MYHATILRAYEVCIYELYIEPDSVRNTTFSLFMVVLIIILMAIRIFVPRDPDILARLMEEQQRVLKDPSTPLTWKHLGEMELLHNCMRESLRMFPPEVRAI